MRVAHRGIVHNRQGVVGGSHGLSSRPKVVFSKTKRAVAGLGMAVRLKNGQLSIVTGSNSRPSVSHSRIQTFVHLGLQGPQGPQGLENGTTTLALEKFGQASCSHSSRHAGHLLLPGIQGFLRWARLDLVDPHHPLRPFWRHQA
uniref:Pre-mRNA cleavage complex 2 protein Pcf11 n=1 Tax=Rhipicephalus appendiculatus TaxID=34631 RepID=A0A131YBQ0_RHIAP